MVALKDRRLPEQSRILDFLANCRRELPPILAAEPHEGQIRLKVGKGAATISLEPAPIAPAQVEAACQRAWHWPEAPEALRGHVAHAAVVLLTEDEDLVNATLGLSGLVAAVAACAEAVGVYWAASGLVHPPDAFIAFTQDANEEYLPLNLWVDFQIMENEDGSRSLSTTGMGQFRHAEIEVHRSRQEPELLMERAFKMAHYLLENGPILEDEETVELSEQESTPVRYGPSMWDASLRVLRLEI